MNYKESHCLIYRLPEIKVVKDGYNFGVRKNTDEDKGIDYFCWKDIGDGKKVVFAQNVCESHCLADKIDESNILTDERMKEAIERCEQEILKNNNKNR